MILFDFPDS